MAKNVNIVFNEDGSLLQAESSATGIRQGDSNGEVTIRAVFQNRRNDSYVAKFHFERPDGKKQRNVIMTPSSTASNEFDYSIGPAWFFAVPGTAKVTVTITDSSGAIAAQGSYSFNVEATQVDVVDSTLTYDEAADLEGLIADISETAVKTATSIPLSAGTTVTQFFAACKAYYDDPSLIRDGDRMLGSFLNAQGARVTYVGQFYGQGSMIVVRTERRENSSTVPVKNETFIAYDGLNGEEYHELSTEEYVDSFFNADGMANNAVADRLDNTIDLTYETKADALSKLNDAKDYTDILQENLEDGSIRVREAEYALKDYTGNVITATYETKADALSKLNEAKQYADLLTNEVLAGEVVVGKASADEDGRNFDEYYLRHEHVVDNTNSTSTALPLSANQGRVLKGLIDSIQTLLESDDTDLDTLQEIVNYIKDNKDLIDAITITKISYSDIVDNLTTELAGKPLSAKQGVVLKGLIDALSLAKVAYTDAEDSLTSSSTTKYLTANQGKVLKALIDSLERFYVDLDGIAEPYDSTATYVKGDIVAYESSLYKAKVDITTAEAFTIAHWEEIVLTDEIKGKLSKGDYDGSTGVGYSDVANNLTPYSDESGAPQNKPMISQGTGTDNNTSIVTTGNFAQLREKQGNTVPIIQLFNKNDFSSKTVNGITITNNGDGSFTLNGTATANTWDIMETPQYIVGHKYLIIHNYSDNIVHDTNSWFFSIRSASSYSYGTNDVVFTAVSDDRGYAWRVNNGTTLNNVRFEPVIVDITSWPADVITDLTAHPDHFSWYYNGSLAYNAGSLENSNGVKLVCTHRNLFAGNDTSSAQYIGHYLIASPTYELYEDYSYNTYRVMVVPNREFFIGRSDGSLLTNIAIKRFLDKDLNLISGDTVGYNYKYGVFTTPANCRYVEFSVPTSLGDVVDLELYYTDAEGGEGYVDGNGTPIHYPYEEPTVVDTGSEVLRSAGNHKDTKVPSGIINRVISEQEDLSAKTWSTDSGVHYTQLTNMATGGGWRTVCSKYVYYSYNSIGSLSNLPSGGFTVSSNYIYINSGESNPSGYVQYLLATPTTEEGTPFPENVTIDDYGMMYWLDENDELVGIPQGARFFYPVNYKGFTDDLNNRTGGDAGKVVVQSELAQYVKQVDVSDQITGVSGLTYVIKKAYRIGNIVTLTIRATSSSSITAGAQLMTLGSGIYNANGSLRFFADVSGTNAKVSVNTSGVVTCDTDIPNGSALVFTTSYAVA